MADVVVAVNQSSDQGVTPAPVAMLTADTYLVRNNGRVLLRIDKQGAGAANITIATPKTIGDLTVEERVVAVPSGEVRFIGPFAPGTYNDPSGDISVTTDEETGITLEAYGI